MYSRSYEGEVAVRIFISVRLVCRNFVLTEYDYFPLQIVTGRLENFSWKAANVAALIHFCFKENTDRGYFCLITSRNPFSAHPNTRLFESWVHFHLAPELLIFCLTSTPPSHNWANASAQCSSILLPTDWNITFLDSVVVRPQPALPSQRLRRSPHIYINFSAKQILLYVSSCTYQHLPS